MANHNKISDVSKFTTMTPAHMEAVRDHLIVTYIFPTPLDGSHKKYTKTSTRYKQRVIHKSESRRILNDMLDNVLNKFIFWWRTSFSSEVYLLKF